MLLWPRAAEPATSAGVDARDVRSPSGFERVPIFDQVARGCGGWGVGVGVVRACVRARVVFCWCITRVVLICDVSQKAALRVNAHAASDPMLCESCSRACARARALSCWERVGAHLRAAGALVEEAERPRNQVEPSSLTGAPVLTLMHFILLFGRNVKKKKFSGRIFKC